MKQELLEHLIRHCVREVLSQMKKSETKGAVAPPADGLGTADQPAIPKEDLNESLKKEIKRLVNEVLDTK